MKATLATIGLLTVQAVLASQILYEADRLEDIPLHSYNHHKNRLAIGVDLVNKRVRLMSFENGLVPESIPFHGRNNRKILQDCGYDTSGLPQTDCATATPTSTPTPAYIDFIEEVNGSVSTAFLGDFVKPQSQEEAIIGTDDRSRVVDTQVFPYRTIGRLFFRCNGQGSACTATLIGPRTIITSAHCLYSQKHKVDCDTFEFAPAQQGNLKPFGSVKATDYFYPAEYAINENIKDDYGVLTLEQDIGYDAGWMGFGFSCSSTVQDLYTAGYPNDKDPFSSTMFEANCLGQQLDACPCQDYDDVDVCPQQDESFIFRHTCDTFRGQSGSPLWAWINYPQIRGIHSSALISTSSVRNAAVTVGQVVYTFFKDNYESDYYNY